MPSDAAPDRPKFPQLQWQLPETSSYAPEAFETLVHINPDQSQSSTPAKASSSGQAPTRMPQTKREERQRPQTSGQLRASSRQAATRAPQRWSDSGNPGSEQVQKAGGAPKLEWALPPALSPVKAIKGGQRLASKLLSAKQATASKGEAAPSGGLANSGGRRISASVSTGSAPSSASQSAGSADTGKWSRLQALKQQRSAHVLAVLEAGRASPPSSTSEPAASPAAAATPSPEASPTRAAHSLAKRPSNPRTSAPLAELPTVSSAAARLQVERLAAAADAAPREDGQPLITCPGCSRSFIPPAYERHAKICAKVFQTKRKAFDMAAARAPEVASDGTFGDVPALKRRSDTGASRAAGGRAALGRAPAAKPKGQAKWKAQSAQLRAAMAAGRGGAQAGGGAAAGFAPAPEPDMSLVPCPHCGRRFNDTAAERHIPRCRDIVAKPSRLLAGKGRGAHVRR